MIYSCTELMILREKKSQMHVCNKFQLEAIIFYVQLNKEIDMNYNACANRRFIFFKLNEIRLFSLFINSTKRNYLFDSSSSHVNI